MRILVTSSRFPHALAVVRKLGRAGHEVYAADAFRTAPGSHSRFVRASFVTPAPADAPRAFVDSVAEIVQQRGIDLVVPCFEEAFYLAPLAHTLAPATLFCPPRDTLLTLHDKARFAAWAARLGLRVPETRVAHDAVELRDAARAFGEYVARPVFSRGGTRVATNAGPLAGMWSLDECDPSPALPWIVQRFARGEDVCTSSVAHRGRLLAHCAYEHPRTIEHAGGIAFVSVDDRESLSVAQRVVEASGYHGSIGLDFVRTREGLALIECNPRPTAGVFLMDPRAFADAVTGAAREPAVTRAGVRGQIGAALVRDMLHDWRAIPWDMRALFSGVEDVYYQHDDPWPGLYQLLAYSHVVAYRHRYPRAARALRGADLVEAQFYDVAWNGGDGPR